LEIRASAIHRFGVYAVQPIPPRRKVIEYTGERISRREAKRRSADASRICLFGLDAYWSIDGSVGGSGAEYINHSCDPNLYSRTQYGHILYMSVRRIERGEELTVDYRISSRVNKVRCRCGSPVCRGTLNLEK
jgi:SET domain-containing protein